ncbi:uncharacterized protein TM35_000171350 [Trypanosoma theileri]|uniref:Uncharacterized protein n=1 Tax=Trypanosoma theileri TaxID=67003 RepID=A0A1X0NUU4_9TRYP|nr:uncharacterized protein TM35_000171350 [Trypanosoma theileri]ORC88263.1 hypothetical protein TM35_000171350 [Trypanosoma theileri]
MSVTPDYFHCLTDTRFRSCVYEPEADTFLLLEALDKDAVLLRRMSPRRCVEVGCGSGTVISHLMLVLSGIAGCAEKLPEEEKVAGVKYHGVDVNPVALEATEMTWSKTINQHFKGDEMPHLQLHQGDLFTPFEEESCSGEEGSNATFDVILFNPPYVPTSMEEFLGAGTQGDFITAAWCGGPRGRIVVDRFISSLPKFLSSNGVCYIIAIKENDVPDMMKAICSAFENNTQYNDAISVDVVAERYTGEYLKVLRVIRRRQYQVAHIG